ncbi:MAG TPA: hypothetical protein VLB11_09220 [Methyloceanibacter sp.]|nr:hypothetical protein [Methyloceanibacter sp.]
MTGSKYLRVLAVVAALALLGFDPRSAIAEDVPEASPAEDSADAQPSPRSPLRVDSFDYKDASEGEGKLTIAGVALPGNDLYLFFDDQPLAKVVPDDGGKWSVEKDLKLEDGRHTLRAEQYDPVTRMLAARATISIERVKQPSDGAPKTP